MVCLSASVSVPLCLCMSLFLPLPLSLSVQKVTHNIHFGLTCYSLFFSHAKAAVVFQAEILQSSCFHLVAELSPQDIAANVPEGLKGKADPETFLLSFSPVVVGITPCPEIVRRSWLISLARRVRERKDTGNQKSFCPLLPICSPHSGSLSPPRDTTWTSIQC